MVLEKPLNGWVNIHVCDFKERASYLTDVPVDILQSLIAAYNHHIPAAIKFDAEGWEDKVLTIMPEQAETVRRVFADYLCGKGMQVIAKALNTEGIPCKHEDAQWRKESIAYLLRNERYIGDSMFQKTFTTDTLPFTKVLNNGEKDRYYVSNSHDAIISREDFKKVQLLLENRKAKYGKGSRREYVFKGKIKCGDCGNLFRRKESGDEIYWSCYKHYHDKDSCPITQIPEGSLQLHTVVWLRKR